MQLQKAIVLIILIVETISSLQSFLQAQSNNSIEIFLNNHEISSRQKDQIPRALFLSSWNSAGIKYAVKYAHKFTTIVLCHYDLMFFENSFQLAGEKLEMSILREIKKANRNIQILLRIYVASTSKAIFEYIGSSTKKIGEIASEIVELMSNLKVNGILYDSAFNTPSNGTDLGSRAHDKFAIVLNSYIVAKVKQLSIKKQKVYYSLKNPWHTTNQVDFKTLSELKVDGFMIAALQNSNYDQLIHSALLMANNIRLVKQGLELFVILPLFSRRNGIGIKTSICKGFLEKNRVSHRGFKNNMCLLIENETNAVNLVPCGVYFQNALDLAKEYEIGLAYFQASDAIQKQFQLI